MNAMWTSARRFVGNERAAQLVEFALVFPILLFVTAGIIDLGLVIKDYQVLTNAAREGARLGSIEGTGDDIVENRVAAYAAAGGLTAAPDTLVQEVTVDNGGGLSFTAVDVVVSYEHDFLMLAPLSELIQAASLPASVTLTTKATMRREAVSGD
jgi:Flp pilus assembly protein TadG